MEAQLVVSSGTMLDRRLKSGTMGNRSQPVSAQFEVALLPGAIPIVPQRFRLASNPTKVVSEFTRNFKIGCGSYS